MVVIPTAYGLMFTDFEVNYHEDMRDEVVLWHRHVRPELLTDEGAVHRAIDQAIAASY